MPEKRNIPKAPKGKTWKGEIRAIDDLQPHPLNPRIVRDHKFKDLLRSVKGAPWMLYEKPIKYVDTGIVLCGNIRLQVCKQLGFTHVPCEDVSYLSDDQREELRMKDNVHAGEWDTEMLANHFDHTTLDTWGINLGVMDFSDPSEPIAGPQNETNDPELTGNSSGTGGAPDPVKPETAHVDPKSGELQFPLGIVVNKVEQLQWSQLKDQLGSKRDSEAFKALLKVLRHHDVTILRKPETVEA